MSFHIDCKGEGVPFISYPLMLSYHASAYIKAVTQGKIYPLQNKLILQMLFTKPFAPV